MFEHLDDPTPPEHGTTLREHVVNKGRARQRRTRLAIGGVALTPLLALGGMAVYIRDQSSELNRIEVAGLEPVDLNPPADSLPPVDSDPTNTEPGLAEVPPIAAPTNVLVVGVDRRPPGSDVQGSRSDTIAVIRIDPIQNRVSVLSLPRDLWITTDSGTSNRINSFTDDGALVGVVSSLLNIDINHYVEVDFEGFASLIDLAGGVRIPFDTAVRDEQTGFAADAGCNDMSGAQALAYVRSRRFEMFDPDTDSWIQDPQSDFGRVARQQDLMRRIYTTVLSQSYSTTDKVRLLSDVVDDLTVDAGLDLDGVRAIFNAAAIIGVENFETFDLAAVVSGAEIDGSSVLTFDPAGLQAEVDTFLNGQPATIESDATPATNQGIGPAATPC